MGGLIGYVKDAGTFSYNIIAHGIRATNRSTADHSLGGIIGGTSDSALPDCLDGSNYFSGDYDTSGPAVSCGAQLAVSDLKTASNPSSVNFPIPRRDMSWDGVNSGNQAFDPGCSSDDEGRYWDLTGINPAALVRGIQDPISLIQGDLILCHNGSYQKINYLTKDSELAAIYDWVMPDDGNDFPRLAFESEIEKEVPYLKRECSGHYSSQSGSGTQADPKWICTYDQLMAMVADGNSYYQLKKNIDYEGTVGAFSTFASGVYNLDGNGFGLYNFTMTAPSTVGSSELNVGLFSKLENGSLITNLKLFAPKITAAISSDNSNSVVNIGLLAGVNAGTISNSKVDFGELDITPNSSFDGTMSVGGFVGNNLGAISKIKDDSHLIIHDGNFHSTGHEYFGGSVGNNSGKIVAVLSRSTVNRQKNCTASNGVVTISDNEFISPFLGINQVSAAVREIDVGGALSILSTSTFTNCSLSQDGYLARFVAQNLGDVSDFTNSTKVFNSGLSIRPIELFATNIGTVARGIVHAEDDQINFLMAPTINVTSGLSWLLPTDSNSTNQVVAPQITIHCGSSIYDSGFYYIVSGSLASSTNSNIGSQISGQALSSGDLIFCSGIPSTSINIGSWKYVPSKFSSGILTAVTDVLYLSKGLFAPLTLNSGLWNEGQLTYSLTDSGNGLHASHGGTDLLTNDNDWLVGTDFFNPGNNVWLLQPNDNQEYIKAPELVRTGGNLESLGPIF